MKKRTFILTFFMMFCSLVFGQNTGWGDGFNPYAYEKSMTVVSFISINGDMQAGSNLEVGAFCGNEMRGKASMKEVHGANETRHLAYITIYGNADGETISFKLYDNSYGVEKVIYPSAYWARQQGQTTEIGTITFKANDVFGTTANPATINFADAAKIGSVYYPTLAEAFAAAEEGQTVEMLRNVTEDFAVSNANNVTFNMAGKTLTGAILPSTANLTVKNGTIVNNNTSYSAIEITSGSIVLNEDVKVSSVRHAIRIDGAVAATIKGGEYTLIPKSGRTHHALNVSGAANVTIEGGKFVGPKGTASDSGSAVNVQSGATVAISGGEFSGGKLNTLASSGALSLTGGKYDQDVQKYCAEGYMTVKGTDGWYTVVKAAAKIVETGKIYPTLAEAFAAAKAGETVEMLRDVTEDFAISNANNVTFNMAGKTLTGAILPSTANLTVKNGTIVNNNTSCSAIEITSGSIVLNEDVKVSSVRHAIRIDGAVAATIKGGEYTLIPKSGRTHHALNVSNGGNVTILGGKFVGPKGTASDSGSAVNVQSGATVAISGGEFSGGKLNTLASSGALSLTGGKYDQDVQKYCAEGYMTVKGTDGWYTVVKAIAKIEQTGKIYATLSEAFAAATEGQTVVMLSNAEEVVNINKEAAVTLNMAGFTLTGSILAPSANLTVTNGTINNTNKNVSAIEINAGTLTLESTVTVNSARHALRIDGSVTATINGGTYKSAQGTGTGTYHAANISGAANVTIKGGTFVGPKGTTADSGAAVNVQSGAAVTIEGGEFSGGKRNTLASSGTLSLTGGKYDQDVQKYCAAGYMTVKNGEWYEVVEAAAKIVETGKIYSTLADAFAAATEGQTVEMLRDVTEEFAISNDANVTFNMAGKTLTGAILPSAANLTVTNGTIVNNNTSYSAIEINSGSIVLNENVKVSSVRHAIRIDGAVAATIKGGEYTLIPKSGRTHHALNVSGAANVTIEGGKFVGPKGTASDSGSAIKVQTGATVAISGGEFSGGKTKTLSSDGTLSLTGGKYDQDVQKYCAAGYMTVKGTDNWYTVVEAAAKIVETGVNYATFDEAYKAAKKDQTIELFRTAVITNFKSWVNYSTKQITVKAEFGETAFRVQDGAYVWFGDMTIESDDYCIIVGASDGTSGANVQIFGGTYYGATTAISVTKGDVNIMDGTFKVEPYQGSYEYTINCVDANYKNGTADVSIQGGKFYNFNPQNNAAEGAGTNFLVARYAAVKEGDWYKVVDAVAKIDSNKYYGTLAAAVEAAQAGETVTVLRNATGAGVVIDKDITINFGGFTYTFNEGVGSTGTETLGLQIMKDNTVVLQNGKLTSEGEDIKMLVQNYANLTLNNMDLVDATDYIQYALSNNSGNVNIIGNTNITTDAVAFDVYDYTKYNYTLPVVNVNTTGVIRGAIEVSAGLENNLTITGGSFTYDVTDYCADGYICSYANGLYNVTASPVAKIGDTTYPTLAAAVAAAQDGATITILRNTIGAGVVIDKSVTIDFAKNLYSFKSGVGSNGTETNGFQILAGNEVTLKNGALEVAPKFRNNFYILVQNYADLNVVDMKLDGTNLDKYSSTDGDSYALSNNSGTVNITGSTAIKANDEGDKAFAFDVCKYQNYAAPVVNVNTTGIIDGKIEVAAEINSNLNISGGYFTVEIQEAWCAYGYIPTTVDLNGTTYYTVEGNFVARNTTTGQKYAKLQDAVDAANAGDTIELLKDITLEGGYENDTEAGLGIELPGNVGDTGNEKGLTIDGKGFTIDCGDFTKGIRIYNYVSGRPSIVTFNNVTIQNEMHNGRCIDTRSGNINLKINNTNLIAREGNSQPLTIGGTEKIHRVSLGNNTTIDAGNSGYGVICFVSTNVDVITSGSTKINGYAAFYIHGDALDVQLDLGQGTYTGKNIHSGESNAFGTIVLEGDNTMVKMIGTNPTINAIAEGTATQAAFLVLGENNTISIESQTANINPQGENAYWAMIDAEVAETTTIKDNGTPLLPAAEADGFQFMTLEEAIRYAKDTVKVVNANTVANPIIVEKDLTLNLNGKAITATEIYPVIRIQNDANVTVTGAGSITNATDYVFVLGSSDKATAGNLTIKNGTYVGATTVASVTTGALAIEGGDFSLVEGTTDYRYLINCIDANYNNNSANVAITGGTFHNWNPENNAAEGAGTNFCAPGYTALESTNVWTVVVGLRRTLEQGWSWFSSYINISGEEGLEAIETALGTSGLQIKGQLGFVDYNSGWGWNGNLETTSVKEMYMIQTSEQVELVLTGELADPATEITLQKGWTYIGYPVTTAMNVETAFGINPQDGDIIKTHDGVAMYYKDLKTENGELWSGWDGSLKSLTPGVGYMYKNTSGAAKTLVYPTPNANTRAAVKANVTAENNHWAPKASAFANNMNIIAVLESNDMMGEFEVAAFVNGEVRGSARPTYVEPIDAYVLFMTIYGEEGEEVSFKYYDIYSDEEHSISNTVNYSDNAVIGSIREPYMFFANTLGMDENAASTLSLYPNPTTTNTAISFETTFDMVEVFNSLGAKVAEYRNVDRIEGIEAAGVYVIRVTNDSAVQNCRLIVK